MCSNCYYSALHWLPNLVCVIMLFIAEVMRQEQPYRISEVIELCVKYKERKSFLMNCAIGKYIWQGGMKRDRKNWR